MLLAWKTNVHVIVDITLLLTTFLVSVSACIKYMYRYNYICTHFGCTLIVIFTPHNNNNIIIMQILMSVSFQTLMIVFMLAVITHWAALCVSVVLDLYQTVKIIALVMEFHSRHLDVLIINYCTIIVIVVDIDECATDIDNCDINADCTNIEGSYTCTCRNLYFGDGLSCSSKILIVN